MQKGVFQIEFCKFLNDPHKLPFNEKHCFRMCNNIDITHGKNTALNN